MRIGYLEKLSVLSSLISSHKLQKLKPCSTHDQNFSSADVHGNLLNAHLLRQTHVRPSHQRFRSIAESFNASHGMSSQVVANSEHNDKYHLVTRTDEEGVSIMHSLILHALLTRRWCLEVSSHLVTCGLGLPRGFYAARRRTSMLASMLLLCSSTTILFQVRTSLFVVHPLQ